MSTYRSVPQQVEAEQFDGTDITKIITLAGPENVLFANGNLQVLAEDGRWVDVRPGWWVTKRESGGIIIRSNEAFSPEWRAVDGSHAGG